MAPTLTGVNPSDNFGDSPSGSNWEEAALSAGINLLKGERKKDPDISPIKGSMTATLLRDMAECGLKAKKHYHKSEAPIRPSAFAMATLQHGSQYEAELIADPSLWKKLLEQVAPETLEKEFAYYDGTTAKSKAQVLEALETICQKQAPTVCYQIPTESNEKGGIVDLAFWTGSHWIIGEIKNTGNPKSDAAHQILHYKNCWRTWAPKGDLLKNTSFILHPQPGFEYSEGSENWRRTCLESTTISTFNDNEALESYQRASEKLTELPKEEPKPYESALKSHCPECRYRIGCYTTFLEDREHPEGPKLETADLNPSEIKEIIEITGSQRCLPALKMVTQLTCIHNGNPKRIESLKKRLRSATLKGGVSNWKPPPINPSSLIFFIAGSGESAAWMDSDGNLLDEAPEINKDSILVTFTAKEKRWISLQTRQQRPTIIGLQEEIRDQTHFPYENLTLRGIADTLANIAEEDWWTFAETTLIPRLIQTRANETSSPEEWDHNKRDQCIRTAWLALNKLNEQCGE